jgi:hypothetical protein
MGTGLACAFARRQRPPGARHPEPRPIRTEQPGSPPRASANLSSSRARRYAPQPLFEVHVAPPGSLSLPTTPHVRYRYGDVWIIRRRKVALSQCHGSDSRVDCVVVTAGDPGIVGSVQPAAADGRPRIRGVAPPRRTNLAPPVTPISLCCFSLGCGVVPGDDVRLRDGRQRCASPTTRGCRRKREQSLPAASSWLLAQEPDVDPARVPEATGAPIRRHRRRDRNRLDGVGDQPSPSR